MSNTATRLITLIMLLQRRPNQKAGELASTLGVSVRTVRRYMAMLEEMGIPIYSERGPHGGFSLVRGYRMPPLVFTPEEAVAVYLGTGFVSEMWGRLYGEAARGALAKLDNVLPDEQRHEVAWARRKLLATGFHRGDQESIATALEKLRRAVRERRRLQVVYRSRSQPEPRLRFVDPYALVHRWGWWYAIGYCHLRQAVRSFRVDRMLELVLTDEGFDEPVDFEVRAYMEHEMRFQPIVKARLCFSPRFALLALDDRAQWDSVEELPDGSVIVGLSTPEIEWAASMVLAYGGAAQVLEPEALRQLVLERAQGLVALHSADLLDAD